jgi:hypothetical protein
MKLVNRNQWLRTTARRRIHPAACRRTHEEGEEPLGAEDSILTLRPYSKGEERCPECELLLYTVYFVTCTICNTKILLGNIWEGKLKYRWLNNHRCFCGNKKELLTSQEPRYYIWDMECFTEEAIWREGSELGHQCSVSEHKPIFIAACNMANTADRMSSKVKIAWTAFSP